MMKLDDRGDRAEAQPAADRRAAALQPVEAAEHPGALVGRDARAVVCDLGNRARGLTREPQSDRRPGRGVMKSVLDEVDEELREKASIASDLHISRYLGPQRAPTFLDCRGISLGHRA